MIRPRAVVGCRAPRSLSSRTCRRSSRPIKFGLCPLGPQIRARLEILSDPLIDVLDHFAGLSVSGEPVSPHATPLGGRLIDAVDHWRAKRVDGAGSAPTPDPQVRFDRWDRSAIRASEPTRSGASPNGARHPRSEAKL